MPGYRQKIGFGLAPGRDPGLQGGSQAAFHIRQYISLRRGSNMTTQELFIFLISLATQWAEIGREVQLLLISNNINAHYAVDRSMISYEMFDWMRTEGLLVPDSLGNFILGKSEGDVKKALSQRYPHDFNNRFDMLMEAMVVESSEHQLKERVVTLWDNLLHRSNHRYPSLVILNNTPAANKVGAETNAIPYVRPDAIVEFLLARQVVVNWENKIREVLYQYMENTNEAGSEYWVSSPAVRRPTATSSPEEGAATSIQEASEASFGHFVVGTEICYQGRMGRLRLGRHTGF